MNAAVRVKNLKKSYGGNEVLKGFDLEIERGEIFALLGKNGAGKTTALECIEGLKKFDCGQISVKERWEYRRRILRFRLISKRLRLFDYSRAGEGLSLTARQ